MRTEHGGFSTLLGSLALVSKTNRLYVGKLFLWIAVTALAYCHSVQKTLAESIVQPVLDETHIESTDVSSELNSESIALIPEKTVSTPKATPPKLLAKPKPVTKPVLKSVVELAEQVDISTLPESPTRLEGTPAPAIGSTAKREINESPPQGSSGGQAVTLPLPIEKPTDSLQVPAVGAREAPAETIPPASLSPNANSQPSLPAIPPTEFNYPPQSTIGASPLMQPAAPFVQTAEPLGPLAAQSLETAPNAIQAIAPESAPMISAEQVLPTSEFNAEGSEQKLPVPYWITEGKLAIKAPLERAATVDIDSLIWASLAHSPYIQSIQMRPRILETEIDQAQGVFDPTRFASSIWNDRSDPVGNTLTTGGSSRFNEQLLDNKAGVRKKNDLGGNWEASQELGLRDNNSNFFVPRKQADSKMVLRYTQPLMKGAGRTYNRASISVAQLTFNASNHETSRALQTHVLDVIESYWELVYQRSVELQLHRGMVRLQAIETELTNRSDLDAIRNQLLRASSSLSGLKARHARAMAQIVQSEERLRQLVNAPWIQPNLIDEIIPSTSPSDSRVMIQMEQELDIALMSRPDVLAIRDEIQAAGIRLRVAEQDLRPTLNLVTDVYVRGLNGQYDVANSLGDQFTTGAPSYSGGLEYLRPKNQTVATAIRRARDLEMRQLLFQLEEKLLQTGTEVRSAIATIHATQVELSSSVEGALASQAEVEYLDARWKSGAFLEPTQISLSLEQLMDAEQRLIQAEANWAASQSQYMISIAKLRYASGNLLSIESEPTAP